MTPQSTYTLRQSTHPQLSNESQNLLDVGYSIILQTSGFFNKHKHIHMHENTPVIDKHKNSFLQKTNLRTEIGISFSLPCLPTNV